MPVSAPLPALAARLRAGGPVFACWSGARDSLGLEVMLGAGCEVAVIDWQHGLADARSVSEGIQAAAALGKAALVRLGLDDVGEAARFLDWGAAGIIAPMINSAEDARALVRALRYAPLGERSFGPVRAAALAGVATSRDYFACANDITFLFAMIETRAGLAALDEILAVPGLDGVLVGPNDLCIALTDGAVVDPLHPLVEEALDTIAASARRAGKLAAAFCPSGAQAGALARRGYALVSIATEAMLLRQVSAQEVAAARAAL